MKKTLLLLCALCVITGSTYAADDNTNNIPQRKNPPTKEEMQKIHKAREAAFEQKLGLTEAQKVQARELRKQGFERMKPVMDEIHQKRLETRKIKQSDLSAAEREEKLAVIDKDLQELQKKAREIKKQNMKEFEEILTKEQKKTLKNMKKEGRKKFEQTRKQCPPPPPCPISEK